MLSALRTPPTVHIVGFPDDVLPREIVNLVRSFPGFQAVELSVHPPPTKACPQPGPFLATITFQSAIQAADCAHSLDRYQFDLSDYRLLLHATSSIRSKPHQPPSKRPRSGHDGGELLPSNHPITTLFCGNLTGQVDEKEVQQVVKDLSGFVKIRFAGNRAENTMMFATFDSVDSALAARASLQGLCLRSSSQPMRIQFARNQTGAISPTTNEKVVEAPACGAISTLFVGNLDNNVTQQEAIDLFMTYPGYCMTRFTTASSPESPTIAFVSYDTVKNASVAMKGLKHHCLRSIPLRVMFARKQMSCLGEQQQQQQQHHPPQFPYSYYPFELY